jgi:N-acetyl sugar amidotransferase
MSSKLVILTIEYPDPLLDKELCELAKSFDQVYVLPQTMSLTAEFITLPSNVIIAAIFQPTILQSPFRLVLTHWYPLLRTYAWTIIHSPYRKNYIKFIKSFIGHFLKESEKVVPLLTYIKSEKLEDALFYDFWLVDATLALAELKRKKIVKYCVSRVHGFDLYHERQFENHVPFQEYRIRFLDAVYAISDHGYHYLKSKIHESLHDRIRLSYLGVKNPADTIQVRRTEDFYRIVTCARLIPLKRISLLVDALMLTSLPIQWIHFGSGPEFDSISAKAKLLPSNVKADLRNETNNEEIMAFYANNFVDLFVSVSESEGLPVSIMEAISFGIPILACSINGIPEIVTEQTGVKLAIKSSPWEIKNQLEHTLTHRNFNRLKIRSFFRSTFDAHKNVSSFTKELRRIMNSTNEGRHQQCVRCVLDVNDDPNISFDTDGVCNYCRNYELNEKKFVKTGADGKAALGEIVSKIKAAGAGNQYDCILGISGGVDSTYLAYQAKRLGLRPLLVHFDNGWNSELAVKNIENIVNKLGFDLHTLVIDWNEFRDLQLAFLKASVIDIEIPTDHAMLATLYQLAIKKDIRYILSGHNVVTESILPTNWYFNKRDHIHVKAINELFGEQPLKTFPLLSSWLKFRVEYNNIESVSLLNLMDYNKKEVKALITKELGWRDYGGKHYESIFTRFYQGYILVRKFGVDKRKAHLSNLICSGQMSRSEAFQILSEPPYPQALFATDKEFVLKKFQMNELQFEEIMNAPTKSHFDYPVDRPIYDRFLLLRLARPIWHLIKKIKRGGS